MTRATELVHASPFRLSRLLRPALLLALMLPGWVVAAGDDAMRAQKLLERVAQVSVSLNYDGTFVYRNGDWMESLRIIHRAGSADGPGPQSRLMSLSGAAREVIRDANRVTCILADSESVQVSKSKPRAVTGFSVFNPRGDFHHNYSLSTADGERVAGRGTRQVSVMPNDSYRYGYRLSVDNETGLLLKSELLDLHGKPLEQIIYTTLSLPKSIPDELLKPGISGQGFTWYTRDAPRAPAQESSWSVNWLPSGFMMQDRATDPAALGRMPVEHLVYTDGLALVSVFIEHLKASGDGLEGISQVGAVNAFGIMVDGYQVTAVGEVPAEAVERVARSVVNH
ncbi:MAG: sigma-E factor negative regulatory protein RseB [Gammaproteobacteria bacterium]|jgi:sigma-E factor negative regulatory protein RseB